MGINYGPDGEPILWYDLNGQPISSNDYAKIGKLFRDKKRHIAKTVLRHNRQRVAVSTVLLVADHNFMGGPPVLWETMIFGGPSDCDGSQWRYASRGAAKKGHRDAVAFLKLAFAVERAGKARRRRMHADYRARWA